MDWGMQERGQAGTEAPKPTKFNYLTLTIQIVTLINILI